MYAIKLNVSSFEEGQEQPCACTEVSDPVSANTSPSAVSRHRQQRGALSSVTGYNTYSWLYIQLTASPPRSSSALLSASPPSSHALTRQSSPARPRQPAHASTRQLNSRHATAATTTHLRSRQSMPQGHHHLLWSLASLAHELVERGEDRVVSCAGDGREGVECGLGEVEKCL